MEAADEVVGGSESSVTDLVIPANPKTFPGSSFSGTRWHEQKRTTKLRKNLIIPFHSWKSQFITFLFSPIIQFKLFSFPQTTQDKTKQNLFLIYPIRFQELFHPQRLVQIIPISVHLGLLLLRPLEVLPAGRNLLLKLVLGQQLAGLAEVLNGGLELARVVETLIFNKKK